MATQEPIEALPAQRALVVDSHATKRAILLHQLSGWGDRGKCRRAGMDDHPPKPIRTDEREPDPPMTRCPMSLSMPLPLARRPGQLAHRRGRWALFLLLSMAAALPAPIGAQTTPPNLTRLSIEDLMDIEITSASRKEERVMDVASAVFVITQDDIRRSGMTTIPDLLRLAPGVNVGQINANKWAVSVRGFNSLFANKLLVLVDGRSVYNRLYSGVFWDMLDLMVDDIDRIEVIRGPGASAWGANAVNGVINIVTTSAADSQGGLVRAEAGRSGTQASIRYGGTAFNTQYRVFAQWTGRDESVVAPGVRASDASYNVTAGFRGNRTTRRGAFTLEGAFTSGRTRPLWTNLNPATAAAEPVLRDSSEAYRWHVMGRWAHIAWRGVRLQIQSSLGLADRREAVGHFTRHAFDLEVQARRTTATRHDIVAGATYRQVGERLDGMNSVSLTPPDNHSTLLTAFAQDDIALAARRVHLILGTQVQHDSLSGTGMQPTARLMWHLRPHQRLWAAASRALRTPSLTDRGIRIGLLPVPTTTGLPLFPILLGNPTLESETFSDLEAGYRIEVGTTGSIDATAFAGRYENLITGVTSAPTLVLVPAPHLTVLSQYRNQSTATSRGLEVAGRWTPRPSWSVDASVSVLAVTTRVPGDAAVEADGPRLQWQLRTVFAPASRATVTAGLFHAGRLPTAGIQGYTRADLTAEWRLTDRLALMAIGQNLLTAAHPEFIGEWALIASTQVPRSVGVRLRWTPK